MQENVTFMSDGLKISGVLCLPDNVPKGKKLPCIMVLHGFGSNKTSDNVKIPCKMLNEWGYAALGFDMRGCGESEGTRANLICMEQVADTRNAVTYLQSRPEIDGSKIGVLGSSHFTPFRSGMSTRMPPRSNKRHRGTGTFGLTSPVAELVRLARQPSGCAKKLSTQQLDNAVLHW